MSTVPAASHLEASFNITSVNELSTRERQVLALITNGRSNQEIVDTLFLGMNTIKTYIRSIYRKIGVTSRTQAVLWGLHHGLLEGYCVVPAVDEPPPLRIV